MSHEGVPVGLGEYVSMCRGGDAVNSDLLIEHYLEYLAIEKGLSKNTIVSYRRDLAKLQQFLEDGQGDTLVGAQQTAIVSFVAEIRRNGASPRSVSRAISAVRGFYRYLLATKRMESDPTINIESPRLERRLPTVLTEDEVERLLAFSRRHEPLDLRDTAILELMYATGLRASEVISLKMGDVHLELGYVRCIGKGSKERIVPVGSKAIAALESTSPGAGTLVSRTVLRACSSTRGEALTGRLWKLIKKRVRAGIAAGHASYASASLRLICCLTGQISGPSRRCSDTPTSQQLRYIRTWTSRASNRYTCRHTRGRSPGTNERRGLHVWSAESHPHRDGRSRNRSRT